MLKARAYDLCVKCHSEIVARAKVGQHHSVSGQASKCAACHDAHDGSIPGMLKAPLMELCERCHRLEDVKPSDHTPEFLKEHGKSSNQPTGAVFPVTVAMVVKSVTGLKCLTLKGLP